MTKDATVKELNPEQGQQPQVIKCGVLPAELVQQLVDFVRDTPAPRKVTDPLIIGLQQVQYADFPMRAPEQK